MGKPLYTSASAIDTADINNSGCMRKWYFGKILKLPEIRKGSTIFGDVIHAVCERFLEADENGCLDGKPVDLYPKGWHHPVNKWTGKAEAEGISISEQALIKSLITKAIEEGVLMRVEGREVEKKIASWPVMEGVLVNGFIDQLEPGAIRDHKSTKAMKWAKSVKRDSSNSLYKNVQLMLYAYWYYTAGNWPKDQVLALSHQYYVKDPSNPHVEKREVSVTWEEVKTFFDERIQPVMELMMIYREVDGFEDIPLPECPESACKKYGGCPFASICTKQESVKQYTRRIEKAISGENKTNYKEVAESLTKGEKTMSESPVQRKLREAREKREGIKAGASKPSQAPVAKKEAPKPEPKKEAPAPVEKTTAPMSEQLTMPWYNDGCKACSKNDVKGMKSSGTEPCKICDVMRKKAGLKTSDDYTFTAEEGVITVYDNETGEEVLSTASNEEVTAKEVVSDPEPVVEEVAEEPVVEEEVVQEVEEAIQKAEETPAPEDEHLGSLTKKEEPVEPEGTDTVFERPDSVGERMKFRLLINSVTSESKVRGGGKPGSPSCRMTIEEVMMFSERELIKIVGAKKWAGMNSFDKKDVLSAYGSQIALAMGSSTVTACNIPRGSLLEALVTAIRPHAGEVIQAVV